MMTSIALAVGLLAVSADVPPGMIGPGSTQQPRMEMIRAPLPGGSSTVPGGSSTMPSFADQSSTTGGECNECSDGSCDSCRRHRFPCASTCNMMPHYAYISDWDFYYYFRPYNYIHIRQQQEIVTRWGGDVRNPYANEMFEKVYEGLEDSVRAGAKKSAPIIPMPLSDRSKSQSRMRLGSTVGFSK